LQLARLFNSDEHAEDLARLVAIRRADFPGDPNLPLWDATAKFLGKKYADAVEILTANRTIIEGEKFNRYHWLNLYIRSQVRLKEFDAARAEANKLDHGRKDWWHIAMVECAAGNVTPGTQALDAYLQGGDIDDLASLYEDPDIGPALATTAF